MSEEKPIEYTKDIPVTFLIRITKRKGEKTERAILIAKDEKGKEFAFLYEDYNGETQFLVIEDR